MKKILITLLSAVFVFAISPVVFAEVESMIGKKVQGQFPVKVNGELLETQAIVIDGTSYLPVRAIGEALGKEIKFSSDLGIEVNDKEVPKVTDRSTQQELQSRQEMSEEDAAAIQRSEAQIIQLTQRINENNVMIKEFEAEKAKAEDRLAQTTDELERTNLIGEIEGWQTKIDTAREVNKMSQNGIEQLREYIEKIRAKYQTVE